MDYKTKTQTSFDVSMETAGTLVPVTSTPSQEVWPEDPLTAGVDFECDGAEEVIVNRLANVGLEPTEAEVDEAIAEFDDEYPTIAEVVREREAFVAKRERVFAGIKGQLKVAAASLMASAVVISGIGFVSRTFNSASYDEKVEECMLRSDQSEGFECIYK